MSSNRQSSGTVDAPTHRFFDGGNFALFVADAGAKAADGYYTHRNLTLFAWNSALWVLNFYVMSNTNNLLSPRDAARFIGVSYSTIKQWILTGKLKTVKTPGGHHRIAQTSLRPFLVKDQMKARNESRDRYRRVSGRNQLAGKVVSIRVDGLIAEVVLAVADTHITAIITSNAVRELRLKKGDSAAALIKATEVMIERLDNPL